MRTQNLIVACLFLSLVMQAAQGDIILSTSSSSYSQDFNSLANSGTSSVLPDGWFLFESGTNANSNYTAGTGSSSTADSYSFGAASSSERALGGLRSNTFDPFIGVRLEAGGATTLHSLAVQYTGEQWRFGTTNRGVADRLDFQYSTNATSLNTGTWLDFDSLDFIAPVSTGTAGSRIGNDSGNRTTLNGTITGLSLLSGQSIWFRWQDFNVSDSDDGLAVDDFSVTASFSSAAVPEPSTVLFLAGLSGACAVRQFRRGHRRTRSVS